MVLGVEVRIAPDAEADDALRVRLVADDADDERRGADEHADRRAEGGRAAFVGLGLREGVDRLRLLPGGFVQEAVDADQRRRLARAQTRNRLLGKGGKREKQLCSGAERRGVQPPCHAQRISMACVADSLSRGAGAEDVAS